jgi:hypothetical protein
MAGWKTQAEVALIKKQYPAGTRLELDYMNERDMPPGLKGIINFVDDQGMLHMLWENGRMLGLIPDVDRFHVLPQPEPEPSVAEPDSEIER